MKYRCTKHSLMKLLSGVTVSVLLVVSVGPFAHPKKAEAAVWYDPMNTVFNGISKVANTVAASAQATLTFKELTLDGIAFIMVNLVLHEMSKSMITWINSGFQGSPAFVTNFGGFLTNVADRAAGNFIWGSELNFLCSPFKLDIRIALDIMYKKTRDFKSQCTLTKVVGNVERFLGGDFLAGGWDGLFEVSARPMNNPYGALLLAQTETSVRLTGVKETATKKLDFGKGFLDSELCYDDEVGHHCDTVTPGTAIEAQLNNTLDSGQRRLHVADEFNEVLTALFTQLASQAFSGIGGLLGATGNSGAAGESNYYDKMANDTTSVGLQDDSFSPILTAITNEQTYLALQERIVQLIDDAENYELTAYGTTTCSNATLPGSLITTRNKAKTNVTTAETVIADLTVMQASYEATSSPFIRNDILKQYSALQASGKLHSLIDTETIKLEELPDIEKAVQQYKSLVDMQCNAGATSGA